MSYRIYRTDAIVLRSYPYREADRTLVLYTEDFGLVYARAQGIRHEKSKMRYALTDFSRAQVALVRGKGGWRVTGAVGTPEQLRDRAGLLSFARVAQLITRLVQGEEQNAYLFETLRSAYAQLHSGMQPELVEVVSVSRILHALGYIAPAEADAAIFADGAYETDSLGMVESALPRLVRRINETLAETQL